MDILGVLIRKFFKVTNIMKNIEHLGGLAVSIYIKTVLI
jgi:hypothetical protein